MITILTIDEMLLYTGWMRGPDDSERMGLCELMNWDPRINDVDDLARGYVFDAQLLAVPEGLANHLGILSQDNPFAAERERRRVDRGHSIIRAHYPDLALIEKLIILKK